MPVYIGGGPRQPGNTLVTDLNASGNISANNLISVQGVISQEYFYANGQPVRTSPGGANGQIQFNDNGNFGGSQFLTYDSVAGTVTLRRGVSAWGTVIAGTFQGNAISVSGNVQAANVQSPVVAAGAVQTDNLRYANGSPYVIPTAAAGANLSLQYNFGNALAGANNFQYISATDTLSGNNYAANSVVAGSLRFQTNIINAQSGGILIQTNDEDIVINTSGVATRSYVDLRDGVVGIGPNVRLYGQVTLDPGANITLGNTIVVGNVTANTITANLDLYAGNVRTDRIYYANGLAYQPAAGSVNQFQYNAGGQLAGAATLTYDTVSGNVITANLTAQILRASDVVSTANISALGTISAAANIIAAGNISAANINVALALRAGSLTAVGPITAGNAFISGNITTNGISTDGYRYANGQPLQFLISTGGANTQVQYNDNGVLGGTAAFTFDRSTSNLSITGNISAQQTVSAASVRATSTVSTPVLALTSGGFNLALQSSALASDVTLTLPANTGSAGQALISDGTGQLSWGLAAARAGGNVQEIQFHSSNGALAGIPGFTVSSVGTLSVPASILVAGSADIGGQLDVTGNIVGANLISQRFLIGSNAAISGTVTVGDDIYGEYFYGTGVVVSSVTVADVINSGGNITTNRNLVSVFANIGDATIGRLRTPGDADVGGNAVIGGNLTVIGNINTTNVNSLTVNDLTITVANGAINPAAANGGGLLVDGADVSFLYNYISNAMVLSHALNTPALNATRGGFVDAIAENFYGRTANLRTITSGNSFTISAPTSMTINSPFARVIGNFVVQGGNITGNLNADNIVYGTLAAARGGTGIGTLPQAGQILIGTGTGYTLANITAGANITVTQAAGAVTIAANTQIPFAPGGAGAIQFASAGNTLSGSNRFTYNSATNTFTTGNVNAGNLFLGRNSNIYWEDGNFYVPAPRGGAEGGVAVVRNGNLTTYNEFYYDYTNQELEVTRANVANRISVWSDTSGSGSQDNWLDIEISGANGGALVSYPNIWAKGINTTELHLGAGNGVGGRVVFESPVTFEAGTTVSGNVINTGNITANGFFYPNGVNILSNIVTPAGPNNSLQIRQGDDFQGTANLTFDDTSRHLRVLGNITAGTVGAIAPSAASWTARSISGAGSLTGLATNGTLTVAVGTNYIGTSTDGVTFVAQNIAALGSPNFTAVDYAGGRFVALAANGASYFSTTGLSWTQGNLLPGTTNPQGIGSVGINFVTASGNTIQRSSSGSAWAQVFNDNLVILGPAGEGAGRFLVGSNIGRVYVSSDTTTWVSGETIATGGVSITALGGNLNTMMAGLSNGAIYTSNTANVQIWQRTATLPAVPAASPVTAITYSTALGQWIVGTRDRGIYYSPDAVTWTLGTSGAFGSIRSILALPTVAMAVGDSGAFLTSGYPYATQGNVTANSILSDRLLYANGQPWQFGGVPGGANFNVQFNNAGVFAGSNNFSWNNTASNLTIAGNVIVTGNIFGTLSAAANANTSLGNTIFGSNIAGQPNVLVTTQGTISVSDRLTVGNSVSNLVISNGSLVATGNITAGNITGTITTTGSNGQILVANAESGLFGLGSITGGNGVTVQANAQGIVITANVGALAAPGSNTNLMFNSNGQFAGSNALGFNNSSNVLTLTGNAAVTRVLTDNLLYANGNAWQFGGIPGGANFSIQYNNLGMFAGSTAFTLDPVSNVLTVVGNTVTGNLTVVNDTTLGGNLTIQGNLRALGNTTFINTETLRVTDLTITVANGAVFPSDANGSGILFGGNATNASILYNSITNSIVSSHTFSASELISGGDLLVSGNIPARGSPGQIQFNRDGNLYADPGLAYDRANTALAVTGNVAAGGYLFGNAAFLTGLPATYSNANVFSYLGSNSNVDIITTGNAVVRGLRILDSTVITPTTITYSPGAISLGLATSAVTTVNIGSAAVPTSQLNMRGSIGVSGNLQVVGNISAPGPNSAVLFKRDGNIAAAANLEFIPDGAAPGVDLLRLTGRFEASSISSANVTTLTVANLSITLADGANTPFEARGAGIYLGGANASWLYDDIRDSMVLNKNLETLDLLSGNIVADSVTTAGNVIADLFIGNSIIITGNTTLSNVSTNRITAVDADISNTVTANSFVGNTLTLAGNIAAGNIAVGNISTGAISATGLAATGNVTAGNLTTSGSIFGNTVNITNGGSLGNANVTIGAITLAGPQGNVYAVNFIGNVVGNISGNIQAAGSNTQVLFNNNGTVAGNAGLTFDYSTQTLTAAGNIVAATATITGNAQVGNIAGTGAVFETVTAAANVTTPTARFYTGVGSFATVSANISSGTNTQFILPTSNGTANTVLVNLGSGETAWASVLTPPGGANRSLQFNSNGQFDGSGSLLWTADNDLEVIGNIVVDGYISANGNVIFADTVEANIANVSGNVNAGNVLAQANIYAGEFLFGNGAFITGLPAQYSNANVAAYLPTYLGNISGGNLSLTRDSYIGGNTGIAGVATVGVLAPGGANTRIDLGNIQASNTVTASNFVGNGQALTDMFVTVIRRSGNVAVALNT